MHRQWIVVVDDRSARLLSLRETPGGGWQATDRSTLDNPWEDYHEHRRPDALDARPSQKSREHFSSGSAESSTGEERRRFARDVVRWLGLKHHMIGDEPLTVFAAPGFFGVLRDDVAAMPRPPDLRELELTRLGPAELAEHPGVLLALDATRA